MIHLRRRHGDDSPPCQACPLGEVEAGGDRGKERVEPFQPLGEIPSDEHRSRPHEGNLAHDVILLQVDLAFVQAGVRLPEDIGGTPHRFEIVLGPGNEELGAGQSGVSSLRLGHECPQGVRAGAGIRMQEPEIVDIACGRADALIERLDPPQVGFDVSHDHDLGSGLVDLSLHRCNGRAEVGPFDDSQEDPDSRGIGSRFRGRSARG